MTPVAPFPAYVHALVPLKGRLSVEHGEEYRFFGPEAPSVELLRYLEESGALQEQYERPVAARLTFLHVPLPGELLLEPSIALLRLAESVFAVKANVRPSAALADAVNDDKSLAYTVVHVEIPADEVTASQGLPHFIAAAIEYVQRFVVAHDATAPGHIVPPPTMATVPPLIPCAVEWLEADGSSRWDELTLMLVNNAPENFAEHASSLTSLEKRVLDRFLWMESFNHPWATAQELLVEGMLAISRGDFRAGTVLTAASTEVMLDGLLGSLLWEEQIRPKEAAALFQDSGLVSRVKRHYSQRLGGSWDVTRHETPVGRWHREVFLLRHRVVHAGHRPDEEEALRAADAAHLFMDYIADRLQGPSTMRSYPITSAVYIGAERLEGAAKSSRTLRKLLDETYEVTPLLIHQRWAHFLNSARSGVDLSAPQPDDELTTVAVVTKTDVNWYLFDRELQIACRSERPPDLTEESVEQLRNQAESDEGGTITSVWMGDLSSPLPGESWRPAYELLPLEMIYLPPS